MTVEVDVRMTTPVSCRESPPAALECDMRAPTARRSQSGDRVHNSLTGCSGTAPDLEESRRCALMPLRHMQMLGQVPPLDPAQGRQWIPNYDQIISALNGLTLAGLLFAAGVVVIGGATWALAANRAHTQGVTWGRFMVIGGFVGAVVIGAASAIVNAGFRLGS
jgi:hypothetical protein